ncbi:NfeD family protein [Waddlia chondrophila]|uniref:Putative membrane-bound serine protease n=1 Tax=Waddlia chondrophila (strain ATCC VR-1470 / WSU 86-1044) TaxID=716544 RepID=D6YWQ9_WADCW|nr:NfeD family protein [Waddlia chondrophila]ADI38570.1 putative membrane-bound serine protease [Waddlia chondrophila WSU 86-1044]
MKKLLALLILLIANINADLLELEGYLGKDEVASLESSLDALKKENPEKIVILVNSSSGDLGKVLELAKKIYAMKAELGTRVSVYIDQSAVGPAGVVPFLADELYISYFASWGDIPFGSEGAISTNLLRNTVTSFINPKQKHKETLEVIATAMLDPDVKVVEQDGWKIGEEGKVISPQGETLVINHHQMQKLGLVAGVVSPIEFRKNHQSEKKAAVIKQEEKTVESPGLAGQLEKAIHYQGDEENRIGLIHVDDKNAQISQSTWIYIKSALEYYKKRKPSFIILELNTPGGEVFASQKISDALKEIDTQQGIPVVAFINNWAISAGAMLAYSCRFIAVTKDASMGAAEPVFAGEGGKMETAPEKVNSALRTDFANRASFFGRNPDIAEAMVDKDIILVYRHGRVVRLDSEEKIRTKGPAPDEIISAKGKLLTLSAEEMMKYGVADIKLNPVRTDVISDAEREKGEWPASKMLLFQDPFFKNIPHAVVDEYQMDWKTRFLSFLSKPAVASLLFLGMMIGLYVEFNSPGFGLPGSIGLLCLFLIMLSSYALEVANTLEVILLLVGVLFIALDFFLIPTFGILGVMGVLFFFIGLFGMMLPGIESVDFEFDTQTLNAAGEVFVQRLAWLCGSLVLSIIGIALLSRYALPAFAGFTPLILAGSEENKDEGYVSGIDPKTLPQPGVEGVAMTTLRPAGKVEINRKIYDAITPGGYIEKGEPIKVERLDGGVVVVNKRKREE